VAEQPESEKDQSGGEWGYVPGVAVADVADLHVLSPVRADEHVAGGAVHHGACHGGRGERSEGGPAGGAAAAVAGLGSAASRVALAPCSKPPAPRRLACTSVPPFLFVPFLPPPSPSPPSGFVQRKFGSCAARAHSGPLAACRAPVGRTDGERACGLQRIGDRDGDGDAGARWRAWMEMFRWNQRIWLAAKAAACVSCPVRPTRKRRRNPLSFQRGSSVRVHRTGVRTSVLSWEGGRHRRHDCDPAAASLLLTGYYYHI
jgi:hypothetical protein